MRIVNELLNEVNIPKMYAVKQEFDSTKIENISEYISSKFKKKTEFAIKPNQKIAITCGSRGIRNIDQITKETVKYVKSFGGDPFIIPAMGSHGGATSQGQTDVISSLGVTEESMGCPIRSNMEVVHIGTTEKDEPVFIDKFAKEADGVIVINRIKPHTTFRGEYESGLFKMLAIGLGKQKGAEACHSDGFECMGEKVPRYAEIILKNIDLICGIAVLENAYDETYKIEVLTKKEIPEQEPLLLNEAKRLMPRIPFDEIDVLIVDRIGKEISGAGMDPNITGRYETPYVHGGPSIQRIVVLDLTDSSHGNASGIGMADFTSKRVYNKLNYVQTYMNILTNKLPHTVKIPAVMDNDKNAILAAIKTCLGNTEKDPRIVRIKDTLSLGNLYISENLLGSVKNNPEIKITGFEMSGFDKEGNLF